MAKYRILSLDGGGIRGLVTTIILQRLSDEPGLAGWLDEVDLIAGTSPGGLIALGLADGIDLQRLRDLYECKGPEIFADTILKDIVDLGRMFGAAYDNANLTRELQTLFGNKTLGELSRYVLITSFDLDNESLDPDTRRWKPKLFHNLPGESNDEEQLAYKVGLYTSAAPTYFPTADGFVDGGVYANNPSMCALAQTRDPRNLQLDMRDVVLLSLGTGTPLRYIEGARHDWGYYQWVKPLIDLMLDGVTGIADYQCARLLGAQYHRLDPSFPPGVTPDLDDVERIPFLRDFALDEALVPLGETVEWIKQHWL